MGTPPIRFEIGPLDQRPPLIVDMRGGYAAARFRQGYPITQDTVDLLNDLVREREALDDRAHEALDDRVGA